MSKKRKIFFGLIGGAGVLAGLLLVLYFLGPKIINLDATRQKIESLFSEKVGGTMVYRRVDLSLFPRPFVQLDQASISIPGKLKGTVDALRIYPELMPLLRGAFFFEGELRPKRFQRRRLSSHRQLSGPGAIPLSPPGCSLARGRIQDQHGCASQSGPTRGPSS